MFSSYHKSCNIFRWFNLVFVIDWHQGNLGWHVNRNIIVIVTIDYTVELGSLVEFSDNC